MPMKDRSPVRRLYAENYLRIVLYTFAGSVILTRLWLEVLNFPQISNGELHIAHVLFGGVFLFLGAMLPLMFVNGWVYSIGASLTGFGSGLFIDEIGKFITTNNNYFYPPAAPIIYALFLVLVIYYLRFKNGHTSNPRRKLYSSLEAMQEVLDFDLEKSERIRLESTLKDIGNETEEYKDLAESLLRFLDRRSLKLAPERLSIFERYSQAMSSYFEKFVKRGLQKLFLVVSLEITGFLSFFSLIEAVRATVSREFLLKLTSDIFIYGDLIGTQARTWFLIRLFMEGIVGVMLLVSGWVFLMRRDKKAVEIGQLALIISLTGVNLLLFYFDQFRAVTGVLWDYFLLILILRYKQVYILRK